MFDDINKYHVFMFMLRRPQQPSVGVTELHDRKRLFELVHRVREAAQKGGASTTTDSAKEPSAARKGMQY